jgi:hypothetical protein
VSGILKYGLKNVIGHQNYLDMRNTADVTGGKLIAAVCSQSISGVNAVNLVAFYDIHERKREVLFFYVVDTTRYHFILCSDDYAVTLENLKRKKIVPKLLAGACEFGSLVYSVSCGRSYMNNSDLFLVTRNFFRLDKNQENSKYFQQHRTKCAVTVASLRLI